MLGEHYIYILFSNVFIGKSLVSGDIIMISRQGHFFSQYLMTSLRSKRVSFVFLVMTTFVHLYIPIFNIYTRTSRVWSRLTFVNL